MKRLLAVSALLLVLLAPAVASAKPHKGGGPLAPRSFFGTVAQTQLIEKDFSRMRAVGMGQLRAFVHWGAVEPAPGVHDWAALDATVANAARNGITVMPCLAGSAVWANLTDGLLLGGPPSSDTTRTYFSRTAGAIAARYGPAGDFWRANPSLPSRPIEAIQIGNEQNSPTFWGATPDPAAYAALLRLSASEIYQASPFTKVVLGGMWAPKTSTTLISPASYLRALYTAGAANSFDVIAVHPYAADIRAMSSQIKAMRAVAKRAGDRSVRTMITEFGWSSAGKSGFLIKGRRGQAKMVASSLKTLAANRRAWKIDGVFWYAWQDVDPRVSPCTWCSGAGLLSVAGAQKPAYAAFRRAAR